VSNIPAKLAALPYIKSVFSNTDEINRWLAIDRKKIFITGGTGFFGKWWLACYFYAKKALGIKSDITILSRSPEGFLRDFPECKIEDISWCSGDISTFSDPEIDFDFILHMARNYATASIQDPISQFNSIILGTHQILNTALQCTNCTVLFISSGAVYGKSSDACSENLLTKVDPLGSDNAYLIGKLAAEQLCSLYHKQHNLKVKIARCFTFLGPYLQLDTHFAAGNFIHSVSHDKDIVINSDGSAIRSYMYPSDLINWIMAIMTQGELVTPYNVGSPCPISIHELAQIIIGISGKNVQLRILGKPSANNHRHSYIPDTSFTEKSLNLQTKIDLEQIISSTIKWNLQIILD
jgi:nucleoside-diphosphate-sugar epimerase